MTHLSRLDTDKMFSDMAERGSADDEDYDHQRYDDDDDDYMSGSGDYREYFKCSAKNSYIYIYFRHQADGPDTHTTKVTIAGETEPVNPKTTLAGSSGSRLRISFMLSNLVIPSFIVILFNKY